MLQTVRHRFKQLYCLGTNVAKIGTANTYTFRRNTAIKKFGLLFEYSRGFAIVAYRPQQQIKIIQTKHAASNTGKNEFVLFFNYR